MYSIVHLNVARDDLSSDGNGQFDLAESGVAVPLALHQFYQQLVVTYMEVRPYNCDICSKTFPTVTSDGDQSRVR